VALKDKVNESFCNEILTPKLLIVLLCPLPINNKGMTQLPIQQDLEISLKNIAKDNPLFEEQFLYLIKRLKSTLLIGLF